MNAFASGKAGSILKSFRKKAGLTQEEMAEMLNRSRSCISKIENDSKEVNLSTLFQWLKATNCEAQAAMIMFGADVCAQAAHLMTLVPAYIMPFMAA